MRQDRARIGALSRTAVAVASAALLILASPASTLAQRHGKGAVGGQSTGSAQPRGGNDGSSGRQSGAGASGGGSGRTQTRTDSGRSSSGDGSGESSSGKGRHAGRGGARADDGGSNDGGQTSARVRSRGPATHATGTDSGSSGNETTAGGRTREGNATGRAVPRQPRSGGGRTTVIITDRGHYGGGFYPWGYGGLGFGGYYAGYYDPWYDGYDHGYGYGYDYEGSLRLKMKPREATVYVDGYYAGHVDDFDGVFQRLRMEPGPHRIEVRLDGFEPLMFEVRIQPDRTITYKGDLKELP